MKKILLIFLLGLPVIGFSQSFQVNLQGQKQIGMAGAGTGLAMDEAAIFFNPGAVSFLKQNGVQAGISPLYLKTAFRQTGSAITEYNKDKIATPAMAYAVFGSPENKLRFGIGAYTPFGGAMHWKDDWTGRYTVTSLDLQAIYIQPTVSLKLGEHVGIGGGLVYALGKVDLQQALPLTRENGEAGTAQLKGHSKDFGWNAGIYINTQAGITIGVTHRSQVTANVDDGDAIFVGPSSLQPTLPTKFTAALPLPATTSIGFGIYPSEKVTLALDVNWVHWHKYKELAFDYDNNATIPDTRSARNYHDAAAFRLGFQHQTTAKLALRAGVGYALTPVDDEYVTAEVPDADRLLLSAGIGYQGTKGFGVDLSFLYEDVMSRQQTNGESGLSGEYKTRAYIPGISFSYKF